MQTVFIIAWIILLTAFYSTAVIIASFFGEHGNLAHKVANLWAKALLLVSGIRVKVIGKSNLDPSRAYVYMCNHQSNADIPVLMGCLNVQFRWLAKAELFRIPLFGYAMKRTGAVSIDRSDSRSGLRSFKQAAKTIRDGTSVVIFPEGTRSMDGNISPFKRGGFMLAIEAGVPIVPLILHGTRAVMPKKHLAITPGDVVLEIRPPIETATYGRKGKVRLSEDVRSVICTSFEESR
ncbi:MAG TPA: 1-acyl-sn-glycerol-3-phosphate acyltransferase [Desulfobacteraceae bacterium]|nr:1-acyl-sn-glycerol-3-phosphate acyltransferase [Desulfobacteraceae bacterium]